MRSQCAAGRRTSRSSSGCGSLHAWTLILLLDLDAALVEVDAAEESARLQHAPHPVLMVLCKRMLVHHHRGEALEAERAALECAELAGGLEPSAFTVHAASHAAALHADRDPERCIRELRAAAGPELDATDPSMSSENRLTLVRAAIAAGRLDDADRWATQAASRAARLQLPVSSLRAGCGRAEVLLARGDAARAAALALRPRPSPTASPPRWTPPAPGSSPAARSAPRAMPGRRRRCCSASPPTPAAAARSGCATRPPASSAGSAAASRPRAGVRRSPTAPTGSP